MFIWLELQECTPYRFRRSIYKRGSWYRKYISFPQWWGWSDHWKWTGSKLRRTHTTWRYVCDTHLISGVKDMLSSPIACKSEHRVLLKAYLFGKSIMWCVKRLVSESIKAEQFASESNFSTSSGSHFLLTTTSLSTIRGWWEEMSGIALNVAILEFVPWKVIIDAIRAKTCCLLSSSRVTDSALLKTFFRVAATALPPRVFFFLLEPGENHPSCPLPVQ